jgi:hypothetical protein
MLPPFENRPLLRGVGNCGSLNLPVQDHQNRSSENGVQAGVRHQNTKGSAPCRNQVRMGCFALRVGGGGVDLIADMVEIIAQPGQEISGLASIRVYQPQQSGSRAPVQYTPYTHPGWALAGQVANTVLPILGTGWASAKLAATIGEQIGGVARAPTVVHAPEPTIVQAPAPVVVPAPAPVIVPAPDPVIVHPVIVEPRP